jgi:hypothetical protein
LASQAVYEEISFNTFMVYIAFAWPIYLVFICFAASSYRFNRMALRSSFLEIDEEYFTANLEDGGIVKMHFCNLTRILKNAKYHLLFFGPSHF